MTKSFITMGKNYDDEENYYEEDFYEYFEDEEIQ
jgi:hypothetical protein